MMEQWYSIFPGDITLALLVFQPGCVPRCSDQGGLKWEHVCTVEIFLILLEYPRFYQSFCHFCKVETRVIQPCLQENLVLAASAALHQHAHRTATEYATREATVVFRGDSWVFDSCCRKQWNLSLVHWFLPFTQFPIQPRKFQRAQTLFQHIWQINQIFCKVGRRSFELHSLLGVGSFGSASPTCFKRFQEISGVPRAVKWMIQYIIVYTHIYI